MQILRRLAFSGAILLFCAGLAWSIMRQPALLSSIRLRPLLALLALGAPTAFLIGAAEFYLISKTAGSSRNFRDALSVTVYSAASSMLLPPAGYAIKIAALKSGGASLKRSSASLIAFTALSAGLAFLYSSIALALNGEQQIGMGLFAASLVCLAGCAILFIRLRAGWRGLLLIAVLRIASFPVTAFRYQLAIMAIGSMINFSRASVFVASQSLGIVGSIVPANIGVTEAATAALAPLVGLAHETGFLAAAVGRMTWYAGQAIVSGVALVWVSRVSRDV